MFQLWRLSCTHFIFKTTAEQLRICWIRQSRKCRRHEDSTASRHHVRQSVSTFTFTEQQRMSCARLTDVAVPMCWYDAGITHCHSIRLGCFWTQNKHNQLMIRTRCGAVATDEVRSFRSTVTAVLVVANHQLAVGPRRASCGDL